jgi:DNA-directed RNA polymerase subunit A'
MNDAVSEPYNADYDGDDMNIHVPQSQEAMVEARTLMKVENHIISIRNGQPISGPHQDHVSGSYLFTKTGSVVDRKGAMLLLSRVGINDLPKANKDGMYEGRDIFSMIVPNNITITFRSELCRRCGTCDKEKCIYDSYFVVEKGKIKHGAVTNRVSKKLIYEMFRKNGPKATMEYINNATKLALSSIMKNGFTFSIDDIKLTDKGSEGVKNILDAADKKVEEMIEQYKRGELERIPGKTIKETLEDTIMGELSKARDRTGKITERDLGMNNHAIAMTRAGARGTLLSITQMSACIGQTALRGKRILRGYRNKTLPHFKEDDISAKARGFISSSFRNGLNPIEFFFSSMSGRDSLVDKGIRTARSGYMQRRLIHALLDITLKADKSARDSSGAVIQFKYGEDGLNPMFTSQDTNTLDIKRYVGEKNDERYF